MEAERLKEYFKALPVLEGKTFLLRPVRESDLEAMWAYLNDPPISEFTTWEYHQDQASTRAYLNHVLENYRQGKVENWGIESRGDADLIGMIGFGDVNLLHRHGEVGYVVGRRHWGRGLVTEALRLVVGQGFGPLGLTKIIGRCIAENAGSRRVLEKVGFVQEGLLRKQFVKRGVARDITLFGLLKEEHQDNGH